MITNSDTREQAEAQQRLHFAQRGYVVVDDALDRHFTLQFLAQVMTGRNQPWHYRRGVSSGGGESHYQVLDGDHLASAHGWLIEWYRAMRYRIESIVDTRLETSPHQRSAVNVKYYKANVGCQGPHFDTNPITGLVYLTDSGPPTVLTDLRGERAEIHPRAGTMLILEGKRVLHGVPPARSGPRATIVMNYYHQGHTERPDWIDRAVYENVDPAVA